jgi:hypothetical protein
MTIKELKNNILLALYKRYKEGEMASVGFDKLCSSYSIIYDSKQQLSNAVKSLKSDNFVNAIFFTGGEGLIHNITPDGVLFVEENLLSDDDLVVDGLKDTDKLMKSGATIDVDIETDSEPVTNNVPKSDKSVSTAYNTKENYQEIVDSSVEPCFGVTTLAECYIKQLDKIAKHTNDNFCMLGIFGSWGRGKTYFFQKIKELITERTNKKTGGKTSNNVEDNKQQIKYKIIEFNAWKYQDTPAIWAYLYETIYGEGLNWFEKVCFSIKSKWTFILFIVFYFLFIWFYPQLNDFSENVKSILLNLRWPISIITVLFGVMYTVIKNPFSTYSKIEKHFKRKSYKGTLGIQNVLEQDLESLIKSIVWRPKKKQIILYVDDIDRCATAKMLNVVNSLRLILENAEIQKRMIVICSIDANKLIKAYCSSKFVGNDYNEEQLKEAKEHLDKLFIFGIGLSPIDQSQQIEYLRKLYGSDETQTTIQTPFSASREKHSLIAISGDEELVELTDKKLGEYIGKYLENNKIVELTPRKIRIIYYRLLFANNIMASGKALIKEETLDKIIKLSLNDDFSNFDIDTAGSDVVGMVVPY